MLQQQWSPPIKLPHYVSQVVGSLADTTPQVPWKLMASKRYREMAGVLACGLFFLFFLVRNLDFFPEREPVIYDTAQIDWSRFAYTQYVTNSDYLCNSVMFFEALHRYASRADRVMMYPAHMFRPDEHNSSDTDTRLLIKARDEYDVKLVPITIQHKDDVEDTWADSFTKLLAFNQTQYSRVLSIDSDSMLLQHMDELFLTPSVPVAMPRAYWLLPETQILSSQLVLIEPSAAEFARIMDKIDKSSPNDYDMEIVNYLYRESAMVLPHRRYDMLTGEFRGDNHAKYLGSDVEVWDPAAAYSEAKLVHFSDWPLPKPWVDDSDNVRFEIQPKCVETEEGPEDCTAKIIWNSFYTDFQAKRKEVCNLKVSFQNSTPKKPGQETE